MKIIVGNARKDGKYPVKFIFQGQPNGFGGLSGGKTFNKIYTVEKVKSIPVDYPDSVWTIPAHLIIK